ncbi:proteasome maturation factor UMP1 [Flagelloscypha sp. PMI_526]|nr:proteasome maturation factor UMP1 [Flagelloscypha sp. PMI_526]
MDPSHRLVPAGSIQDCFGERHCNPQLVYTILYNMVPEAWQLKLREAAFRDRLNNWEETQDNLKLTMQRNMYGMHAPMRLLMERKMVGLSPHMPGLPANNLHLDILMGRDEAIEAVDIFGGMEHQLPQNLHSAMEKKRNM